MSPTEAEALSERPGRDGLAGVARPLCRGPDRLHRPPAKPQGYVDAANAEWILRSIFRDGTVKGDAELELLIYILETAESAPDDLQQPAP